MSAHIAKSLLDLRTQFLQIVGRACSLFGTMDGSLFIRHPRAGGWSAAECLAHLNLSVDPYFVVWKEALANAPQAATDNYKPDFWGRLLIWTLEPPPKFRFPVGFRPANIEQPQLVLPEFLKRQEAILQTLDVARGLAIDTIKIVSPFDRRARYSIWSSFCITAVHQRRHLSQAERAACVD